MRTDATRWNCRDKKRQRRMRVHGKSVFLHEQLMIRVKRKK